MLLLLALACSGDKAPDTTPAEAEALAIHTEGYWEVLGAYIEGLGHPDVVLADDHYDGPGTFVSFSTDLDGEGAYRIVEEGAGLVIHVSDVTGAQYGLTHLLEAKGFRFFHPHRTHVPASLSGSIDDILGVEFRPDMARRGLHMHTLHPIEGLYDFWEPGEANLERAKQVVDWVVRNRGNHIQWVALDNITDSDRQREEWTAHTTEIIDYAHQRGVTTGLGVQLFGGANLQRAYDLNDASTIDAEQIRDRVEVLLAPGPDLLNLSFGEFSGEEPDVFIEAGNTATGIMKELDPDLDIPTVIHVGNYPELRIEYQGEEMLYYFLGAKLDHVTPWIHSVMYYNLFEDAGLAYLHEEFDEHRDYLLGALEAGDPVGYFPESAYWVAFDVNLPTYLPLYIRSRFTDMDRVRAEVGAGALQDHVLFSSGWEWGYWQNDVATLRMTYHTPADYRDEVRSWFLPWRSDGELLASAVIDAADVQHQALLVDRLAAYLAGRELVIDLGEQLDGIVSQPDRPQYVEIAAMRPAELDEMQIRVDGLAQLADDLFAIHATLVDIPSDPFVDEVRQGLEVTALRARFAAEVNGSAVAFARGEDAHALYLAAAATLADARSPVDARHADMHWPGGQRILASDDENDTLYQWGYLAKGAELCFWDRELVQLENLLDGTQQSVPTCF